MENEKKITLKLDVKGMENWEKAKDSLKGGIGGVDKDTKEFATKTLPETNKQLKKLLEQSKRVAFYRAIRAALKSVTNAVKEGTLNLYEYSRALNSQDSSNAFNTLNEYKSLFLQVKNTIGAGLAPIIQSLKPAVEALADAFIKLFNSINAVFHMFRGDDSFTVATRLSADKLASANKSAKELKKTLFGFDELNVLNAPNSGGGGFSAEDYKNMFEEVEMNDEFKAKLKAQLQDVERMVGGYALTLGAILAFTGHIPLGVGLIAAGAVSLVASAGIDWNTLGDNIEQKISNITMLVSGALLAVGAILALSAVNIPLGVGLMAAGVIGVSAAALNWDGTNSEVRRTIEKITGVVSAAVLAIGAILLLSSANVPLGLGMIAAGAVGLAATKSFEFESIENKVNVVLTSLVAIVSSAALAIGILMMFNPATIPLGIGLFVAGLAGSVTAYSISNNPITEMVRNLVNAIVTVFEAGANSLIDIVNGLAKIVNKVFGTNWGNFEHVILTRIGVDTEISGSRRDLQPRATGGMVTPGSMFIAGERGAELITATSNGVNVSTRDQIAESVASGNESVVNALFAVANTLVNTINAQDYGSDVYIGDRDIVRAYDRGKRLMGNSLVEV